MSTPQFATRPPITDVSPPARATGMNVASRLIRLDPGWFSLSLMPGQVDPGTGLPSVRVSLPPNGAGRRETVSISMMRADGWMSTGDEPTLLRVSPAGGEILVTQYWSSALPGSQPPPLKLERLHPETGAASQPGSGPPAPVAPPPVAEIVAHIEGVGDVDGKLGDWVGMRGSGRSIEGFSLAPRIGLTTDEFDTRAVLGRDWLSPWVPGGRFCGSRGLALPLRGFCVRLHPMAAARLELVVFARFIDGSEIGPVGPGAICAAPSLAALEAFQLRARPLVG
jgi:hypothetical protein